LVWTSCLQWSVMQQGTVYLHNTVGARDFKL
jgi:hypothetical protein